MSKVLALRKPELMEIADPNGITYRGGSQEWYTDKWQRRAGCGPTNASLMMWYLSRRSPELAELCPYAADHKSGFLQLMEDLWQYVTPGRMGVNTTDMFLDGALAYANNKGYRLEGHALNVPRDRRSRPDWETVCRFFGDYLEEGSPIAFLNLSNGALRNLDKWHWVTLVSLCPTSETAVMYDQGREIKINLGLWLRTTALGGGFVALSPLEASLEHPVSA